VRALLVVLLTAGCGGSASEPQPETPDARVLEDVELFDVRVSFDYVGTQVGSFGIGAFQNDPPDGAPLAYKRLPDATFPGTAELRMLEPGSFYVFAVLDIGPTDLTIPGDEDLIVASPLLTLVDQDLDVELVLTDEMDATGGDR
jgi:hypothetical protein